MVTAGRSAAGRISLAGQFLVLQLIVLLAVLAVASVVSVRQSDADFRDTRGARLRAARREPGRHSAVRSGLADASVRRRRWRRTPQRTQTVYDANAVYLARPDGHRRRGGSDPTAVGERVDLGDSTVRAARRGPATSTTAAAGRSRRRCRCIGDDGRADRDRRWSPRATRRWRDRARDVLPDLADVPRLRAAARRGRLVAAGPADQAPYPRAGAGRDRARSPTSARRCCTRSARAWSRSAADGHGHRDQRQRPRAARAAGRRRRAPGGRPRSRAGGCATP